MNRVERLALTGQRPFVAEQARPRFRPRTSGWAITGVFLGAIVAMQAVLAGRLFVQLFALEGRLADAVYYLGGVLQSPFEGYSAGAIRSRGVFEPETVSAMTGYALIALGGTLVFAMLRLSLHVALAQAIAIVLQALGRLTLWGLNGTGAATIAAARWTRDTGIPETRRWTRETGIPQSLRLARAADRTGRRTASEGGRLSLDYLTQIGAVTLWLLEASGRTLFWVLELIGARTIAAGRWVSGTGFPTARDWASRVLETSGRLAYGLLDAVGRVTLVVLGLVGARTIATGRWTAKSALPRARRLSGVAIVGTREATASLDHGVTEVQRSTLRLIASMKESARADLRSIRSSTASRQTQRATALRRGATANTPEDDHAA